MPESTHYDAIVVGAGISGALVAQQLADAGKRVLILEAGPGSIPPEADRKGYMQSFYSSLAKVPSAPYPPDGTGDPGEQNAPRATVLMINDWKDPKKSYLTYKESSPLPFGSSYERVVGGTTQHWMGSSYRFLPADFEMHTLYGKGADWPAGLVDWPLKYSDLKDFYKSAETEIGVAGDAHGHGIPWDPGDKYPMRRIPPTVLDQVLSQEITGLKYESAELSVSSTPAARNSIKYDGRPACGGHTSCIPICPIRAKYDATVTLRKAMQTGHVELMSKAVVKSVEIDPQSGRISAVRYVRYDKPDGPPSGREESVSARIYVLAAHAIETPKILLNSRSEAFPHGAANSHDQVGRYLMDHPYYLEWGLAKKPVYPFRGPLITSYIGELRDGAFRKDRAAFLIDIGNDGWGFAVGDPDTTVRDFVDGLDESGTNGKKKRYFGRALLEELNHNFTRQWRLGFQIEQSPDATNRVTLSEKHTDHLGIPRPEVNYDFSDYTKRGFKAARQVGRKLVGAMGKRFTSEERDPNSPRQFEYEGEWYQYAGAGHIVGTYRMGCDEKNSVVNSELRCWDHKNLFLVGSGVFPTITTANPTLTVAALALKAAKHILDDLGR